MKPTPNKVYLVRFKGRGNCPAWSDYRPCKVLRDFPTIPALYDLMRFKETGSVDMMSPDYWIAAESPLEYFEILCEVTTEYCVKASLNLEIADYISQLTPLEFPTEFPH